MKSRWIWMGFLTLAGMAPALSAADAAEAIDAADAADTLATVAMPAPPYQTHPESLQEKSGLSPGAALMVGFASTVVPAALTLRPTAKSRSDYEANGPTFTAGAVGLIFGPAFGLWSGNRGDLATHGLLVRCAGTAVFTCAGLGAWISAYDEEGTFVIPIVLATVAAAGGAVVVASSIHDLAITPSAVARGPAPRADLGLRADGVLMARVHF